MLTNAHTPHRGYEATIVMPDDVAIEKVMVLEALGAAVTRVRPGPSSFLCISSALDAGRRHFDRCHLLVTLAVLTSPHCHSASFSVDRRSDPVCQSRPDARPQLWTDRDHRPARRPRRPRTVGVDA